METAQATGYKQQKNLLSITDIRRKAITLI